MLRTPFVPLVPGPGKHRGPGGFFRKEVCGMPYPKLVVDTKKLAHNTRVLAERCAAP